MRHIFRKKNTLISLSILMAVSVFLLIFFKKQNTNEFENQQPNKIVIIGHLYPLLKQQYLSILRSQIEGIKGLKGVIFAGDIVPKSEEKYYDLLKKELVDKIKVPFYYLPANHEMSDLQMFEKKAGQFALINNQNIYFDKTKYILYSAHKQNLKPSKASVDCEDIMGLKKLILENKEAVDRTFLVLADLKCFKRPKWKQIIHPLIKEHIFAVIIGDNASTKYNYTWEKHDGVAYIFQGIAHRGHGLSGDNTFLVMEEGEIKLHHLKIEDALDPSYETKKRFRKLIEK